MGLIYNARDAQALIDGMRRNIEQGRASIDELARASAVLTNSIGPGKPLDGAAFNAGKDLFSELVIPTMKRAEHVFHETQSHLSQFVTANDAVSREGVLDEDKLNEEKWSLQSLKSANDATVWTLRTRANIWEMLLPDWSESLRQSARRLERYGESLEPKIADVERKLQMLHEFDAQVRDLFTEDRKNLKLVVQSIIVLNQTEVNRDGTYTLPPGFDKSWFETEKAQGLGALYEELVKGLSPEGEMLNRIGLTQEEKDWYKRAMILAKNNPAKLYGLLYKHEVLWTIVDKIGMKYPSVADKFLNGMIKLEGIGTMKSVKAFNAGVGKYGTISSPVKTLLKKIGVKGWLEESKFITKLGSGAKIVSNVDAVTTFAGLAFTGISSGISDGIKQKSIGKGVIGGAISMVASVGPLEGMTLLAMVGMPWVGLGVGLTIMGAQFLWPGGVSKLKQTAFDAYDKGVSAVQDIGNGVLQGVDTVKYVVGSGSRGVVRQNISNIISVGV